MVKLFVIEDHATIIVAGLRNIFRPSRDDIEVTGSAVSVQSALPIPELASSDIIILDLWIPGNDPLDNMKLLGEQFPCKPVIIYTSEELPVWQQKMMNAGVKGYVNKNCNREDLKSAIMHVARGGTWFTGPMTGSDPETTGNRQEAGSPVLSPVEKQIIELLISGLHHREIAAKITITPPKIDKVLTGLRKRFDCNTTVELVKLLSDQSLV
jgi:DNA-binding NarL/FixJ family response regulator